MLHVHHGKHHDEADTADRCENTPTVGPLDGAQSIREGGGDRGENQQGHTVAHAVLGNLLAHPHDDGGTGAQGDDDEQNVHHVVLGDDAGAVTQQNAGARHRDDGGSVQQCESDGEVTGVLR